MLIRWHSFCGLHIRNIIRITGPFPLPFCGPNLLVALLLFLRTLLFLSNHELVHALFGRCCPSLWFRTQNSLQQIAMY
jgi:hypothetical protein